DAEDNDEYDGVDERGEELAGELRPGESAAKQQEQRIVEEGDPDAVEELEVDPRPIAAGYAAQRVVQLEGAVNGDPAEVPSGIDRDREGNGKDQGAQGERNGQGRQVPNPGLVRAIDGGLGCGQRRWIKPKTEQIPRMALYS